MYEPKIGEIVRNKENVAPAAVTQIPVSFHRLMFQLSIDIHIFSAAPASSTCELPSSGIHNMSLKSKLASDTASTTPPIAPAAFVASPPVTVLNPPVPMSNAPIEPALFYSDRCVTTSNSN